MFDIIGDVHGQAGKLDALLTRLSYWRRGRWRQAEGRQAVFVGDYIDRGPENARVLTTVRQMVEDGAAHAVMGNHELNAVHFHSTHPVTGRPLRPRTDKNRHQHGTFLAEFPVGAAETEAWIAWMADLPVWLDLGPLRVVHACWHGPSIAAVPRCPGRAMLCRAADPEDPLHRAVETLTKGPEVDLPAGWAFHDKGGARRTAVRLAWWRRAARNWAEATISVPEEAKLPPGDPPPLDGLAYPDAEKPVFFGHYWLTGAPELQAENAVCVDYSAGLGGPLRCYRFADGALSVGRMVS